MDTTWTADRLQTWAPDIPEPEGLFQGPTASFAMKHAFASVERRLHMDKELDAEREQVSKP